jgi:hypothetical protein
MPNRWAISSGNWSNAAIWNGGLGLPTTADDVYSNNFTVTVDQNITVLSLRNGSSAPIVVGGTFALANGVTVTVTAANGLLAAAANLTRITGSDSATIIGSFGSGNIGGPALLISQSANITITGSITGGGNTNVVTINHFSTGTLNISGSVQGGSGTNAHGISKTNTGIVNIVGDVSSDIGPAAGIFNGITSTTYTILGNMIGGRSVAYQDASSAAAAATLIVTGSIYGSNNVSNTLGTIYITSQPTVIISGSIIAGSGGSALSVIRIGGNPAKLTIYGPISASSQQAGIYMDVSNIVPYLTGPFYNANGRNAVFAPNIQLISGSTPTWTFDTETYAEQRTLYTQNFPGNFPSTSNVRSGIIYGDTNQFTGTVAIPSTGSVLKGVPVDNTTGSASFTTQTVWSTPTSSLTASNSLGARLSNTATVASDGILIALTGSL